MDVPVGGDAGSGDANLSIRVTQVGGEQVEAQLTAIGAAGDVASAGAEKANAALAASTAAAKSAADQYMALITARIDAEQALEVEASGYRQVTDATRAFTLAQMQAIEMDKAMSAAAEQSSFSLGGHGLQLGRLNMELGTFIGRLTGANTAVTRLSAMVGGAVVGYAAMIPVLVGVAALIEEFSNKNKEAEKQQEELTKAVEKWYQVQQAGGGQVGQATLELEAQTTKVEELTAKYNALIEAKHGASIADVASSGNEGAVALQAHLDKLVDPAKAAMDEAAAVQAAKATEIQQIQQKELISLSSHNAAMLAERIKFNANDAQARQEGIEMMRRDESLLAIELAKPFNDQNQDAIAATERNITTLSDALQKGGFTLKEYTKAANDLEKELEHLLETEWKQDQQEINRQANAAGTVEDRLHREAMSIKEKVEALNAENEAFRSGAAGHADYQANLEAERLKIQAIDEGLTGPDLDARNAEIEALRKATILHSDLQAEYQADVAEAHKSYAEQMKEAQSFTTMLSETFNRTLDAFVMHGKNSFQSLWDDAAKGFETLILKIGAQNLGSTISGFMKPSDAQIADASFSQGATTVAGALGSWGMAIAGVALVTSSLLGMGNAAQDAAKALQDYENHTAEVTSLWARAAQSGDPNAAFALLQGQGIDVGVGSRLPGDFSRMGMADQASVVDLATKQQQEYTKAVKAGENANTLAALAEVQKQEMIKKTSDLEIAAAQKRYDDAQKSLNTITSLYTTTQATATSLSTYAGQLGADQGGPLAQYNFAKSNFESLYQKALSGDQTAANALQGAGQSFLSSSSSTYATGAGYQSDVTEVQQAVSKVAQNFQAQADAQKLLLDQVTALNDKLNAQLLQLQQAEQKREQDAQRAYDLQALQSAQAIGDSGATVVALNALTRDADTAATEQVNAMMSVLPKLDQTAQTIVAGQLAQTLADQSALDAATKAETDAVAAGASQAQVTALDNIRKLEEQKTANDTAYLKQETYLASIGKLSDSQLQSMEAARKAADDQFNQQINVLNGIANNTGVTASAMDARNPNIFWVHGIGKSGTTPSLSVSPGTPNGNTDVVDAVNSQTPTLKMMVATLAAGFAELRSAHATHNTTANETNRRLKLIEQKLVAIGS